MNTKEFSKKLLELRNDIDDIYSKLTHEEENDEEETEMPSKHYMGKQITLKHPAYGDILMDCIDVSRSGKEGCYLMHYAIPNIEFDAIEAAGRGSPRGNNDYGDSNIRQWLNSEEGDWWYRTHQFDAPPSYANKPGFLYGFDYQSYGIVPFYIPKVGEDLFFLLSYEEVTEEIPYLTTEEGEKLLQKTTKDGVTAFWWLRSPANGITGYSRGVFLGNHGNRCAFNRLSAVAPACVIR